ncbi:TPA: hypothetical protein HA317_01935 [Candidatus Woesearchaeota archaeon]|nr:hypothetical protein [Candidatus Woesearchaeota archaeon]
MQQDDAAREKAIKKGRDVIKLSKRIIYSIHRSDMGTAAKAMAAIKKEVRELASITRGHEVLSFGGFYRAAIAEYVEAACLFHFIQDNRLVSSAELSAEAESYLLGLCDLAGELSRRAFNAVIEEKPEEATRIKDFLSEIYTELLMFDFSNGELRRKFDSVKYELKKLEALAVELKLKQKV